MLPSLAALNSSLPQAVDTPLTFWRRRQHQPQQQQRAPQQPHKPWRIEFRQVIEQNRNGTLQHVVRITVRDGVVSQQETMLSVLSGKFGPLFGNFQALENSGKLFTTCSDHTKSTLEWAFARPYVGMMPTYGVPPVTALPMGSPYMFFKRAFGEQPVRIAQSMYTWTPVPGEAPTVSLESWLLNLHGKAQPKKRTMHTMFW